MKLTYYLEEQFGAKYEGAPRSVEISEEEAQHYLETKCKKTFKDKLNIFRGLKESSSVGTYRFIDPAASTRLSRNTSNHYTLLMDNLPSWSGWPKRSKSIICTTSLGHAWSYGVAYIVIPFDGSVIGVCPDGDIWGSFRRIYELNRKIYDTSVMNDVLVNAMNKVGIKGTDINVTWKQILQAFKKFETIGKDKIIMEFEDEFASLLMDWNDGESLLGHFDFIMSPERNDFDKVIAGSTNKLPRGREIWTEGSSVLARFDLAEKEKEGFGEYAIE